MSVFEEFEPHWRVHIFRTDGVFNNLQFDSSREAWEAFEDAKEAPVHQRLVLLYYSTYDSSEVLAEWTRPSIFNLDD